MLRQDGIELLKFFLNQQTTTICFTFWREQANWFVDWLNLACFSACGLFNPHFIHSVSIDRGYLNSAAQSFLPLPSAS